ncbi:DUF3380 domain-containing protein [Neiella sp. HB171785]|uniref:DUF3380 domain-containing protein n=1 Tax=Neiella litorisoli TaxID=2771431 RepID=A0A8J6UE72_9GAMM|nr:N-acetylmuramidase domain-containing protein [Neiella litorisoli]MBD1389294.1 DUF3380 domain-containing protein [Neiella litorisoli]
MSTVVCTAPLNVRALPVINSQILGVLESGRAIATNGESNAWYEVDFQGSIGYVYGGYVAPVNQYPETFAIVNVGALNVRDQPSASGKKLGLVYRDNVLKVQAITSGWLEIEFNRGIGYVSQSYAKVYAALPGYSAIVTANLLNIRNGPSRQSQIISQVPGGTQLTIDSVIGAWCQLKMNGQQVYTPARYLRQVPVIDEVSSTIEQAAEDEAPLIDKPEADEPAIMQLQPVNKLPVAGSSSQQNVARTWNNYGALLQRLSRAKALDVACAVAVLCVESSGKGFEYDNQNRMIIRFENHKFYRYWGKQHQAQFDQHFKYTKGKAWTGHQWRTSPDHQWQSFHGNQAKEWQAFLFAQSIDKEAAMLSISMGAPQIMGFNYRQIGYDNVEQMFDAFCEGMDSQIAGFFNFFSPAMIKQLQQLDFVAFAKGYNGDGQKQKYGQWIRNHYDAFKHLHDQTLTTNANNRRLA